MTPEEFSKYKDPLGDLDYYEFAELYAKHENEALQKQNEDLENAINLYISKASGDEPIEILVQALKQIDLETEYLRIECDCTQPPFRYNELGTCKYCGKQKNKHSQKSKN